MFQVYCVHRAVLRNVPRKHQKEIAECPFWFRSVRELKFQAANRHKHDAEVVEDSRIA